ncbi:MAG: DUF6788 family protein [Steroidobacteraceae bacterium]
MTKRAEPAERLAACERRYRDLARSLADIGFIASGSVTRRLTHCNKAGCRCGADPPRLHGPYYQWTAKVAGRTVTRRLSSTEAALYTEWIANDRQLRQIINDMRKIADEARQLTLNLASQPDEPPPSQR